MTRPVVEATDLTKRFDDTLAVDTVSLDVHSGEVLGLLGPNGAGKSTLLDMCVGYTRPTSGTVRVFDSDPVTGGAAIRERVGIVPDGYGLYRDWTGRAHLDYFIESNDLDVDPEEVLDRVGLLDAIDRPAAEYSAGMRKRLVLATAIAGDPPLLLLDEPSAGLDPEGMRRLREIVSTQANRGTTVVVSSHQLGQLESFCTRVAVMRDGAIQRIKDVDAFDTDEQSTSVLRLLVEAVPADLGTTVESLDGVEDVQVQGCRVSVTCVGRSKKAVLDAVEATGTTIRDFDVDSRTLESLFFEVTEEGTA
ncbi:ABC transporter ATP-binding protein [Haloarchaeobius sp. HME9146]|uniref:ABC transporter ATP-binding protein n=1 Tax=Haloarchaeobius sp. HME9146 TaxID=2978732 RepID=UPI0021C04B80|nr:ABC transporter ATP-binding protein [Haloarchaeobius sp. HME9146]MCT9094697.1 ABC transporter ATP-binding protein [Haloarchaeobius sp. HME9146]